MINKQLASKLYIAKTNGIILDYSIQLGYEIAEITLEFSRSVSRDHVSKVCDDLLRTHHAFGFLRYPQEDGSAHVKFVVNLL